MFSVHIVIFRIDFDGFFLGISRNLLDFSKSLLCCSARNLNFPKSKVDRYAQICASPSRGSSATINSAQVHSSVGTGGLVSLIAGIQVEKYETLEERTVASSILSVLVGLELLEFLRKHSAISRSSHGDITPSSGGHHLRHLGILLLDGVVGRRHDIGRVQVHVGVHLLHAVLEHRVDEVRMHDLAVALRRSRRCSRLQKGGGCNLVGPCAAVGGCAALTDRSATPPGSQSVRYLAVH